MFLLFGVSPTRSPSHCGDKASFEELRSFLKICTSLWGASLDQIGVANVA